MKYTIILLLTVIFILCAQSTSAIYYAEPTTNIHRYKDSMYLHKDLAPKADIFYTPFNAYRTYCAASYCPSETKIIQVYEVMPKPPQPKTILVQYYRPEQIKYDNNAFYNQLISPTYLY